MARRPLFASVRFVSRTDGRFGAVDDAAATAAAPHTRSRRSSVAAIGGSTILALSVRVFIIRSRGAARVSRTLVVVSVSLQRPRAERGAAPSVHPSIHPSIRDGGLSDEERIRSPFALSSLHLSLVSVKVFQSPTAARARVLSLFALGRTRGRTTTTAEAGPPGTLMILPQVHLRKPCYDFYFL